MCLYIYSGTKACEKLYDVICNKYLLADIKQLSPFQQTSGLESYHSVINHFAPKLLAFSYVGMHCRYILHPCTYDSILKFVIRLLIAAMHFNENYGRAQATTKEGKERIRIVFPKQKQGNFTPKIVPVAKTYSKSNIIAMYTRMIKKLKI